MKRTVAILVVLLGGCSTTVPVKRPFPDATPELMIRCEELKKVESGKNSITDVLKVVVDNYTLYHECSIKVDGWHKWYVDQKRIYEAIDKK